MDADFIVIGGGIAGLSAGARLAAHGSVMLLEQESALGYHASGRSAALFEPNYGPASTIALNRASAAYHQSADGGVLIPRGLLLIGTKDTKDAFAQDRDSMQLHEITLDAAQGHWPILDTTVVTDAAYSNAAQDIDTDRLLGHFAKCLRGNGGTIATNAPVTGILRTSLGWTVTTPQGRYEARQIVNAAGAWADQIAVLAGLDPLRLSPMRRSMARVPAPENMDVKHWPMLFGPGENWYAKPDAGALLVSPADEDATDPHDAYADDLTLAEGLARFEAHVHYTTKRLLASWAGLRTFAPDRALVIGPSAQDSSFLWCAGQGGYGMQSSPAASQLLADLVTGHPSELDPSTIEALSPKRFG